jgi:hypothetical protein
MPEKPLEFRQTSTRHYKMRSKRVTDIVNPNLFDLGLSANSPMRSANAVRIWSISELIANYR